MTFPISAHRRAAGSAGGCRADSLSLSLSRARSFSLSRSLSLTNFSLSLSLTDFCSSKSCWERWRMPHTTQIGSWTRLVQTEPAKHHSRFVQNNIRKTPQPEVEKGSSPISARRRAAESAGGCRADSGARRTAPAAHRAPASSGSGFKLQGSGFRVQASGFRVQGSRFRVPGSGFRVQGPELRISGFVFRVSGFGFRVDNDLARSVVAPPPSGARLAQGARLLLAQRVVLLRGLRG